MNDDKSPTTEQKVSDGIFDSLLQKQLIRQRKRLVRDGLTGEVYDLSERIDFEHKLR